MRKSFILAAALLALLRPALAADSTVAALTAASALGGTELFYCVQAGADRKCTATQLSTFVAPGTGALTALGINVGSAGAFITFNGAGGTPSSLVGTNITGTAAGLTAGNVTTNANLTGQVTSVGNAATLATAQPDVHTWALGQTFTVAPTLASITGSTQCLHVNTSGVVSGTGSDCGAGGGSGTVTSVSVTTANGVSGSVATATTTPNITLTLGAITPTTVNGNTFTTGTFTLTGAAAKTLTFNNSITIAGTDATTMTFPTTTATIARTDAAQTFTGVQTFGVGSAAAPNLVVGNSTTGIFSVSTTGLAFTVNGTSQLDFGITQSAQWTSVVGFRFASNVTMTANTATFQMRGGNTFFNSPATATFQHGGVDAAAPIAQMVNFQSVVAGNANTAGANATFQGSLSNGSGAGGDIIFKTTASAAGSGVQNTAVEGLRVAGGTQLVSLAAITSDATHTDSAICQDTTTHALYSGSGTLGVCLGTSSKRYKNNIVDLKDGLAQIIGLKPKNFFYNADHGDNGAREQFGFIAEDVVGILPKLVGHDAKGLPNSVDMLGMIPVIVSAIQKQQAEINALKKGKTK